MPAFMFRCPKTRRRVQGYVADEQISDDPDEVAVIDCVACGGAHVVRPNDPDGPAEQE